MIVMTYNIKHSIKEDIFGLWRKRYRSAVKYIKEKNPDLVGLQEITRKGKRYLKRNLKDYKIVGKSRHSVIFTNEFNCLLIKKDFKINGHKTYSLSDKIYSLGRKAKTDNFPRICTLAHLEKDNHKYFFINTHIDNSDKENKNRLLDILQSIIDKYKKDDELLIITGDFNMSNKNKNLVRFKEKYVDPFENDKTGSFPRLPELSAIDHIFLDNNFTYKNGLIDTCANDLEYKSDHYPVMCEIKEK